MKQVKFFNFFFLTFFQHEKLRINNKKTIGLQRKDLKLKSRARINSIRKKRGKGNSFYTAGSIGPPVTVPLFFGGVITTY